MEGSRSNWRRTYSVGVDLGDVGKTLEVVESTSANNGNLDRLECCSMNELEEVEEVEQNIKKRRLVPWTFAFSLLSENIVAFSWLSN